MADPDSGLVHCQRTPVLPARKREPTRREDYDYVMRILVLQIGSKKNFLFCFIYQSLTKEISKLFDYCLFLDLIIMT